MKLFKLFFLTIVTFGSITMLKSQSDLELKARKIITGYIEQVQTDLPGIDGKMVDFGLIQDQNYFLQAVSIDFGRFLLKKFDSNGDIYAAFESAKQSYVPGSSNAVPLSLPTGSKKEASQTPLDNTKYLAVRQKVFIIYSDLINF